MLQRDILYFASQKLQGDWSAADFGKHLTSDSLKTLLPKYDRLDPLVRVRLLLSVLTLDSKKLAALQEELKALLALAREDKEEWVSVMARALNTFQPPLNLQAVISGSAAVSKTMEDLEAQLDEGDTTGFRPLEELYLSSPLVDGGEQESEQKIDHSHFRLRNDGANCLEDLYKKASDSAAAAVYSVKPHALPSSGTRTVAGSFTSGMSRNPGRNPEPQSGFRSRPNPSSMPSSRPRPASSHSGVSRLPGESEMFRSSRPIDLGSKPAPSVHTRAVPRPGGVKLVDVEVVKKLNRPQIASPHSSGSVLNSRQRPSKMEESEEEEGEIEDGEFNEEAQSGPAFKRARQTEVLS